MGDPLIMKQLKLVYIKYPSKLLPGIFVIPQIGSGCNFTIGIVKDSFDGKPYSKIIIENEVKEILSVKLQPVKFYLIDNSKLEIGDWFFSEKNNKSPIKDTDSIIGRINTELDVMIFNAGNNSKIIYKSESIGLMRAKSDLFESVVGDPVPINSSLLEAILKNNGICFIENDLIDNKVVITNEQI